MKNIHVLPTDKPSRLHLAYNKYYYLSVEPFIQLDTKNYKSFNIFTTSDEEIREGDWYLIEFNGLKITQCNSVEELISIEGRDDCKKIILTTDQDLIADGVQAIDDEFLEWFVKNPSCEFVKFKKKSRCCGRCNGVDDLCYTDMTCDKHQQNGCEECYGKRVEYEIIIPQEEPKCLTKLEIAKNIAAIGIGKEEPKQETLEEAVRNHLDNFKYSSPLQYAKIGAEWQSERMYSEAIEFAEWIRIKDFQTASKNNWIGLDMKYYTTQELFEQFKNK
jgi:hypothetical protein